MRTPLLSITLVAVILVSTTLANTALSINNSAFISLKVGRWFDYVVVIMMENKDINFTYGISVPPYGWTDSSTCLGNCTSYNSLANSNGLAEEYTQDGTQAASIGSYIAITSGYKNTLQACNSNPPDPSGSCPPLQIPNIVDRLESAHLSWKAYMEGLPQTSGCVTSDAGDPNNYHYNHNPFIYYADILNNATRCSNIVNANSSPVSQMGCWPSAVQNDDLFVNDLNHPLTAANYSFLTPNTVDDAHDCPDVSVSNAWLNVMIPKILGSALFKTKRAALFFTFDEPGCTSGCPSSIPELYTVWASNPSNPTTRAGFKSVNPYNHFSSLRTIEDNWHLPPLIPSTDGSAQNMQEFFP